MESKKGKEVEEKKKEFFAILHLFSSEWSSILVLAHVNARWNILLPAGEGTAVLRTLVLPGIFEHLVDCGEGVLSSWLIGEVPLEVV